MSFFDKQEAAKSLSKIIDVGQVFEVRILDAKRINGHNGTLTAYGVFDKILVACDQIEAFCGDYGYSGVYFTPNPLIESVLARRPNFLDVSNKSDTMASDSDVLKRNWLLIDLDPTRPSGIAASDSELEAARDSARKLFPVLVEKLGCEPLVLKSGNGVHMMFRIDLPSEDEGLSKRCLFAAERQHELVGNRAVHVDIVNFNAARIWKLPGSFARKGHELPEQKRTHRMAELMYAPKSLQAVTRERLEAFAGPVKVDAPRRSDTPLAVPREVFYPEDWLRSHGIAISHTKPWHDATAYVLEQCPFNSSHRSPDSMLLQFADGRIVFFCSHNSCRSKGWFDFREQVEPGWREKRKLSPGFGSEVQSERQRQVLRSMMREEWLLFREFSQQKGI